MQRHLRPLYSFLHQTLNRSFFILFYICEAYHILPGGLFNNRAVYLESINLKMTYRFHIKQEHSFNHKYICSYFYRRQVDLQQSANPILQIARYSSYCCILKNLVALMNNVLGYEIKLCWV